MQQRNAADRLVESHRVGFQVSFVKLPALPKAPARPSLSTKNEAGPPSGEIVTKATVISPEEESARPTAAPIPVQEGLIESKQYYYRWQELTTRPEPLTDLVLDPPESPETNTIEGSLSIELWINEFGTVDRVELLNADKLPEEFKARAISAFSSAGFRPGVIEDQAVKSRMKIEINYRPLPTSTSEDLGESGTQRSLRSQRVESH